MFRKIIQALAGPPADHPFHIPASVQHKESQSLSDAAEGVERMEWGKRIEDVAVSEIRNDGRLSGLEFSVADKETVKLKPVVKTKWDEAVIKRHNLIAENYWLVKPYVVASCYTNEEIAVALGKSKSWANTLVPRVKESLRNEREEKAKATPIGK